MILITDPMRLYGCQRKIECLYLLSSCTVNLSEFHLLSSQVSRHGLKEVKMSQSQPTDALISVRLVVMDHYMASPVPSLDPLVSDFRGYNVKKVPILRIFGSTPAGQRCTLHLHGIFPYMYVPMPEQVFSPCCYDAV